MSWLSQWTGSDDRKRARTAEGQGNEAFAQQEGIYNSLAPWQEQYNQGYLPQFQQVQGMQQGMLNNPWMFQTPQGANGMYGGQGYQGDNYWWGNTPQNTNDIAPALSTLQALGMQGAAGQMRNNTAQFNAQRGVPMSGEQAGLSPGFQTNWLNMLSQENANKALTLNDIMTQRRAEGQNTAMNLNNVATQRRGEAQGNFFNLGQYGQGLMQGATQIPQRGMDMYANRMGMQNQNAQNSWQQAGQKNPFGQMVQLGAYAANRGFSKPKLTGGK